MRTATALIVAVAALAAASPAAADWPDCVARTAPVHTGLTEIGRAAHGRLLMLTLRSRAMAGVQKVNVLLPQRFDRSGRTRYPVLYLLHGAGGDDMSWIKSEHIARFIGDMPVIAVMPDGSQPGRNGGYTDWFGLTAGDAGLAPAWESYHVGELVPFVDHRLPTKPVPGGRAIMGISMGGGGAMKYAAEYPGTFGYAGSLSGSVDPSLGRRSPDCKFGDPDREQVVWRDNDPTALAQNLRGVRLFVRSGDGTPGPYDDPNVPDDPVQRIIRQTRLATEAGAHLMAVNFLAAVRAAGVRGVDSRFYAGSHSAPYWHRELPPFVAWLRAQMRHPPTTPASFSIASAHPTFSAWGMRFTVHRTVREFVYLRAAGHRLTATGSGRLDVVARDGRRLRVDLGPSHTEQQTDFGPGATAEWRTASVRLP